MIFSRGKSRNIAKFNYNGLPLEVVTDYIYLGIDFNYNGKFNKCKKHIFEQAQKAMYNVLRKSKNLCLPIYVQLHLFDHMIASILLLGVNNKTAKCIVYGELGRTPSQASIDKNVLHIWANS